MHKQFLKKMFKERMKKLVALLTKEKQPRMNGKITLIFF